MKTPCISVESDQEGEKWAPKLYNKFQWLKLFCDIYKNKIAIFRVRVGNYFLSGVRGAGWDISR
jgi:hypothetical protein